MVWRGMGKQREEVSEHLARIYRCLLDADDWLTAKEIAKGARVAPRTARAHALKLVGLGVCDQAEVFPGHRYRIAATAEKRNKAFITRLREAVDVFRREKTTTGKVG